MSPRGFLAVIAALMTVGGLLFMFSQVHLDATDKNGNQLACGDVFSDHLETASYADSDNQMGLALTGNQYKFPATDYVNECKSARSIRQFWTIPLAIVGGVLLLGAAVVRQPVKEGEAPAK